MKHITRTKFSYLFLLVTLLISSSCTVKYVAEYDAAIKDEIFLVAKKVDLFWGEILDSKAEDRTYQQFQDKYNQIESDLRSLVMKNQIRELNKETTKQAKIALDLWIEERTVHKKDDGISDFIAKRHRKQYHEVFTAMVKGEEAKNIKPSTATKGATK